MRHFFAATAVFLFSAPIATPQSSPPKVDRATAAEEDIARIMGYSMARGDASTFLETLTDTIGGRITGSPESRATAELILKTLKEAGFDSAHFEEYELRSLWQHGPTKGEVISPIHRALYIGSYGWVPGTSGPIEMPVIDFGAASENHAPTPEQVRGGAVIVEQQSSGVSST